MIAQNTPYIYSHDSRLRNYIFSNIEQKELLWKYPSDEMRALDLININCLSVCNINSKEFVFSPFVQQFRQFSREDKFSQLRQYCGAFDTTVIMFIYSFVIHHFLMYCWKSIFWIISICIYSLLQLFVGKVSHPQISSKVNFEFFPYTNTKTFIEIGTKLKGVIYLILP